MQAFRLPKKIKILGLTYRVRNENIVKNNDLGDINMITRTIRVDPQVDRIKTLSHEIVHAYNYALAGSLDENWTDRIAQTVISFLSDNPALARSMIDYLEDDRK